LIGTASGAETWAAEAYRQTITNSPANPIPYIKLGTVFASQKEYNVALQLFDKAAQIKVDLPTAYYNAALAFKTANDLKSAERAYQQTLTVLEQISGTTSEEYINVTAELEALQKELKNPTTPPASSSSTVSITQPAIEPLTAQTESLEQ
jgi:tetratricopeptide (TPR) repeat protein